MTPRLVIEPARLAGRSLLRLQTDERLVDLVRAGNDRAFEAIVDRYHAPLLRYCARLLPAARAEDVVQQAFVNAIAALRRDEARIDLKPWLYRIAHNAALNALRENGWTHENVEQLTPGYESAHETAERRASLREVLAAVHTLPERQREAILLRELAGHSYAQIAQELDVTGGAVRQLLNRARNTLRAAATALTPAPLLTRLGMAQRVTELASDDGLRGEAARIAGVLAASLALLGGAVEGSHLLPAAAAPRPALRATTGAPGAGGPGASGATALAGDRGAIGAALAAGGRAGAIAPGVELFGAGGVFPPPAKSPTARVPAGAATAHSEASSSADPGPLAAALERAWEGTLGRAGVAPVRPARRSHRRIELGRPARVSKGTDETAPAATIASAGTTSTPAPVPAAAPTPTPEPAVSATTDPTAAAPTPKGDPTP